MTEQQRQEWYAMLKARANTEGTYAVTGGMRLAELGDGWARGELQLEERHRNPMGIVHGGVYCTLMDHVAGAAACTRGSRCLTVDCETRFIGVPAGDKLCGHARAVRMGRTIVVMRAWVTDSADTLCAEGTYTFRMKEGFPKE